VKMLVRLLHHKGLKKEKISGRRGRRAQVNKGAVNMSVPTSCTALTVTTHSLTPGVKRSPP